jgi:hypothetical protein
MRRGKVRVTAETAAGWSAKELRAWQSSSRLVHQKDRDIRPAALAGLKSF